MEHSDLTKSYYKIKEVAEIIGVSQSTLRFWEKEFRELTPRRSAHNQRYYSPEVIEQLRIVHFLLKEKGLKIEAAKEYLRGNKKNLSKRIEILSQLREVRGELEGLMNALDVRAMRATSQS